MPADEAAREVVLHAMTSEASRKRSLPPVANQLVTKFTQVDYTPVSTACITAGR